MAYCQYGEGTSDDECAKFALEVETKVCKKKANENKCEEVEKTSEGDKDTTKDSNKDDTTKDSVESTNKTNNTKEKNNSGKFINIGLGYTFSLCFTLRKKKKIEIKFIK